MWQYISPCEIVLSRALCPYFKKPSFYRKIKTNIVHILIPTHPPFSLVILDLLCLFTLFFCKCILALSTTLRQMLSELWQQLLVSRQCAECWWRGLALAQENKQGQSPGNLKQFHTWQNINRTCCTSRHEFHLHRRKTICAVNVTQWVGGMGEGEGHTDCLMHSVP